MNNVVISVNGVGKKYAIKNKDFADEGGQGLSINNALDNITFDVYEGDSLALIGSNGSGKSTLLGILCGLIKPSTGTVKIAGKVASILDIGSNFIPDLSGGLYSAVLRTAMKRFSPLASSPECSEASSDRSRWRSLRTCSRSSSGDV